MSTENVRYIISMRDKMSRKLGKLDKRSNKLGNTIGRIGARMGATFGAAMIGRDVFKTMTQFEDKMQEVKVLTQANEEQFRSLSQEAQRLGSSTIFSATKVSDAMGYLSKAGFNTKQILTATEDTLNLAAAGNTDLASASDIASDALTAMGLKADKLKDVTDDFATVANSSNTTVKMLGDSFRYAAASANSAGADVGELSAMIGMLGDAGIKGSMAGTQLRQVYMRMMTPAKIKQLQKYGVEVKNANGDLKDMASILKEMEDAGFGAEQAVDVFGARAGNAVQVLLQQGSEALEEYVKKLDDNLGEAERIAEGKTDSLSKDLTMLKSAWDGLVLSIDDGSGTITKGLRSVTQGLTSFLSRVSASEQGSFFVSDYKQDFLDQIFGQTKDMKDKEKRLNVYQEMVAKLDSQVKKMKRERDKEAKKLEVMGAKPGTVAGEGFLSVIGLWGEEQKKAQANIQVIQDRMKAAQDVQKRLKKALRDRRLLNREQQKAEAEEPEGAGGGGNQPSSGSAGVEGRTVTGGAPRNFRIEIENLIDDGVNLQVNNLDEGLPEVQEKIVEALTQALNDITIAQNQ